MGGERGNQRFMGYGKGFKGSLLCRMGSDQSNPKPPEQKFIKRVKFIRTPSHEQKK